MNSPRDHAILEAAYLRNSKPDKAERALIVSEVELGEKEVQVSTRLLRNIATFAHIFLDMVSESTSK